MCRITVCCGPSPGEEQVCPPLIVPYLVSLLCPSHLLRVPQPRTQLDALSSWGDFPGSASAGLVERVARKFCISLRLEVGQTKHKETDHRVLLEKNLSFPGYHSSGYFKSVHEDVV